MLYPCYVLIASTPELLNSPSPSKDALAEARQHLDVKNPVARSEEFLDSMVDVSDGMRILEEVNDRYRGPVDSVIRVSENSEFLGWSVCVWLHENDGDDDDDVDHFIDDVADDFAEDD